MNLRHWIPAIFNLSFPGVGYFLIDKKIFGSLLLLFTIPYQAWYYISHISETYVVPGITYIYLLFGLVSAIHVYRLAKKKYHITEEKKNLTKNAFKRQLFIGLFLFLLFIGYAFLYSNIQTFFGFSKTGPGDAITVLKPIEYKILLFAFDVISSLSCLVIPILSYYLQLKKRPIKRILFSFIGVIIFATGMCVWTFMLEEKIAQEKSIQRDYTSEELMTAFNNRREIYNARQLNQNKYLCKIAELRLIDIVKRGETAFSDQEAFQKDYDYVHGNAQNSQLTKESHVPDNVFVLFTKQTNVDSAISSWEQDFDTSYLLSDTNYEFGCAMVNHGYGVLVIGSDNEPFEPKLEDNMSTVSI